MNITVRAGSWLVATLASLLVCAGPATAGPADEKTTQRVELADDVVLVTNELLKLYSSLPEKYRELLQPVAVDLAAIRRPAMALLIDEAAETALARSLGRADRIRLPEKAIALLETQIDATGDFDHIQHRREFDGQDYRFIEESQRYLRVGDATFLDPSIYGRRLTQLSKENLPVHGIALDDGFAWSALPYRVLDPLERIENQVPADLDAIFVGDELNILPVNGDLAEIAERLIGRENFIGPRLFDPALDGIPELIADMLWTNGAKDILWVPLDFPEAPGSRFTRNADTDATIEDAREWIEGISRGQTTINVTYFPEGTLRLSSADFVAANANPGAAYGAAIRALQAYDEAEGGTGQWLATSWDRVVFLVDDVLRDATGEIRRGAFANDARNMMFYGVTLPFGLQHELGHTYYFAHTFYLAPSTADRTGPGTLLPMPWTYMGQSVVGGDNRQHPASANKLQAYWIASPEVLDATAGGRFRIVSHDRGPAGFARMLRIRTGDAREYYVDMRRLWTDVPELFDGVQVYFTEDTRPGRYIGPLTYVGATSSFSPFTSPLAVGETIEDPTRGVRIRLVAVGESPFIAGAYFADIDVERF